MLRDSDLIKFRVLAAATLVRGLNDLGYNSRFAFAYILLLGGKLHENTFIVLFFVRNQSCLYVYVIFWFILPAAILPKSTNPKHINENMEIFKFKLTSEDMATLDNLNKDTRFCWNPEEVA